MRLVIYHWKALERTFPMIYNIGGFRALCRRFNFIYFLLFFLPCNEIISFLRIFIMKLFLKMASINKKNTYLLNILF